MVLFIPWNFQNKGLGREGPHRLDFKQVLIRQITVSGHHLCLICLNAPQKPFLEGGGGGYYYEVVGHNTTRNPSYSVLVARDFPDTPGGV